MVPNQSQPEHGSPGTKSNSIASLRCTHFLALPILVFTSSGRGADSTACTLHNDPLASLRQPVTFGALRLNVGDLDHKKRGGSRRCLYARPQDHTLET